MRLVIAVLLCFWAPHALAAKVRVATASNFVVALEALSQRFEKASGHQVEIMAGATGTLYAQITQGAPFDLFLAADAKRPALLDAASLTISGTRATYARGQLALWAPNAALHPQMSEKQVAEILRSHPRWRMAIANPQLAPYGFAALQVLTQFAVPQRQWVYGQNVGQAFSLIRSGNAQAGLVARAQLFGRDAQAYWPVPAGMHDPIDQDMVILARAANNPAATALHRYLLSDAAAQLLERAGYLPGQGH